MTISCTSTPARPIAALLLLGPLACGVPANDDALATAGDAPAASGDAIVGGRADTGEDPAVVALLLGEDGLCTGTLVGPRHVLTARHCVSVTSEVVSCPAASRQIARDREPGSILVLVGDTIDTAAPVARGAELVVPPGDVLCDADLALVVLDRDVHGVAPLPLAGPHDGAVGTRLRAVGFGQRSATSGAGQKRVREHVRVIASSPHELLVGEVTCSGDSGGPAIDEATGRVVGVVSRGGPTCSGASVHNVYTRVSAFLDLLGASSDQAPSCGPGLRCAKGTHCDAKTRRCG